MYAEAGIKFSYAVHLRDTGTVSLCFLLTYSFLRSLIVVFVCDAVRLLVTTRDDQTRWRGDGRACRVYRQVHP